MVPKFELNVKIKVINCDDYFNGKTGVTTDIYTDLDVEPVYGIKYDGPYQSYGMFPESKLKEE